MRSIPLSASFRACRIRLRRLVCRFFGGGGKNDFHLRHRRSDRVRVLAVIDHGLFGTIGCLGEEPDSTAGETSFDGFVSVVSDLLISDVQIVGAGAVGV